MRVKPPVAKRKRRRYVVFRLLEGDREEVVQELISKYAEIFGKLSYSLERPREIKVSYLNRDYIIVKVPRGVEDKIIFVSYLIKKGKLLPLKTTGTIRKAVEVAENDSRSRNNGL